MSGEHNPYAAPAAAVAAVEVSFLRDEPRPPRPIAVWLLLLLLFVFTVLFAFGAVRLFWSIFSQGVATRGGWAVALAIAGSAAVPAALIWTGFASYSRKPWSRWVGAALILGYAAYGFLKPEGAYYTNDAQRAGGHLTRTFILPLLCAWWCYAFAFSKKARRYFAKTVADQGTP